MAIKWNHDDNSLMHFCTFTCYNWLNLFEITDSYELVYKWFDVLKKNGHHTIAYVIMPNHIHLILYFPETGYNLNKIISNGKRFMAYGIVDRLKSMKKSELLDYLAGEVTLRERKKGQLHKIFIDSFDAKSIYSEKFFTQKLNYIHLNPVRGKWHLADDYTEYEHSSASYYERGIIKRYVPFDFRM